MLFGQNILYEESKFKKMTDEKWKKTAQRQLRELANLGIQVNMLPVNARKYIQPRNNWFNSFPLQANWSDQCEPVDTFSAVIVSSV
jgi:hypothetical protein